MDGPTSHIRVQCLAQCTLPLQFLEVRTQKTDNRQRCSSGIASHRQVFIRSEWILWEQSIWIVKLEHAPTNHIACLPACHPSISILQSVRCKETYFCPFSCSSSSELVSERECVWNFTSIFSVTGTCWWIGGYVCSSCTIIHENVVRWSRSRPAAPPAAPLETIQFAAEQSEEDAVRVDEVGDEIIICYKINRHTSWTEIATIHLPSYLLVGGRSWGARRNMKDFNKA